MKIFCPPVKIAGCAALQDNPHPGLLPRRWGGHYKVGFLPGNDRRNFWELTNPLLQGGFPFTGNKHVKKYKNRA